MFDIRLRRKCIFLVGDLAACQLDSTDKPELPFFSDSSFLKAVVNLTLADDLDLQEKVINFNLVRNLTGPFRDRLHPK